MARLIATARTNLAKAMALAVAMGGVHDVDGDGNTALMAAIEAHHDEVAQVVRLLVAAGADANAVNAVNGNTPLSCAIETGNEEVVQVLIAAGADVNFVNHVDGNTQLMLAFKCREYRCMRKLLDAGANVDVMTMQAAVVTDPPLATEMFFRLQNRLYDTEDRLYEKENALSVTEEKLRRAETVCRRLVGVIPAWCANAAAARER